MSLRNRLYALPPELFNPIADLVLDFPIEAPRTILIDESYKPPVEHHLTRSYRDRHLGTYYSKNTFQVASIEILYKWLTSLRQSRFWISRIQLPIDLITEGRSKGRQIIEKIRVHLQRATPSIFLASATTDIYFPVRYKKAKKKKKMGGDGEGPICWENWEELAGCGSLQRYGFGRRGMRDSSRS